jgi:hypothetical protein
LLAVTVLEVATALEVEVMAVEVAEVQVVAEAV